MIITLYDNGVQTRVEIPDWIPADMPLHEAVKQSNFKGDAAMNIVKKYKVTFWTGGDWLDSCVVEAASPDEAVTKVRANQELCFAQLKSVEIALDNSKERVYNRGVR